MSPSMLFAYGVCLLLEAAILLRAIQTGVCRQYPLFFAYLSCVFLGDIVMYPAGKLLHPGAFRVCYWSKEFICVIVGYAVVMEVIERAFAHFEGPKRLGRNAAMLTFAAIVAMTALDAAFQRAPNTIRASVEVEANLRGAELILLSIIIVVISYYSIPIGRNLKGIILGYGVCTLAVALNEAFRTFAGPSFQRAFSTIWSYSYIVSLVIWAVALWSYEANPSPAGWTPTDDDYATFASRTRSTLAGMRGYFRKAARP